MTNEELREIVYSGKASYTLSEPDYSKVKFTMQCMSLEDKERGKLRFWPIIKKAEAGITEEEERELHAQHVADLLNKIGDIKRQAVEEKSHFYVASTLGRCCEMIKTLHITNTEISRDNRLLTDHKRLLFAGLAMQSLLVVNKDDCIQTTCEKAFGIADNMVKHGKQNSKTKCTGDDTGIATTENTNYV